MAKRLLETCAADYLDSTLAPEAPAHGHRVTGQNTKVNPAQSR